MPTIIDNATGQIMTFADFRRERYELRMQAILNYAPQPGGPWVASAPWRIDSAVLDALNLAAHFGYACGDVGG